MALTNFARPTLKELRERVIATFNAYLPDTDARLRNSVLNVLAVIEADLANELYGYIDWLAAQIFPDTAEAENLDRWGAMWGVSRKVAGFATGEIAVSGMANAALVSGTEFKRGDGIVYRTVDSVTIPASGKLNVAVKSEKIGLEANADEGVKLTLLSPVSGINTEATVAVNGLTGGAERESDASYAKRIILRMQYRPGGGTVHDYVAWALAVSGVTRAWCYPMEMGPGTVTVRFMMDDTYADGIPQTGDLERVQAYIYEPTRRPITADVFVVAPVPYAVNIEIGALTPDTPEVRAAVEAELLDLFARESHPGQYSYLTNSVSPCIVRVSKIWESVSIAVGAEHFTLAEPLGDIAMVIGTIPVLGNITYI